MHALAGGLWTLVKEEEGRLVEEGGLAEGPELGRGQPHDLYDLGAAHAVWVGRPLRSSPVSPI